MTGYRLLMQQTREFDDMVLNAVEFVNENEAELTENGFSADVLYDRFVERLLEIVGGDWDTFEAVRGEVAAALENTAEYAVTRDLFGKWA